jgi:hypothetical protein
MRGKIFLITVLASLLLLADCKKNFSVNAEYEDFPVVLGLLNASDHAHYIKVYKSFVTEHSAYDAAKDIRLYSYIDSVEVYMEERNAKDTLIRKILFDTTTEIPKDPGIFAFPTQIVYKTNAELNENYSYQLFVYNPYTKKIAYSQPIFLAGPVTIIRPTTKELSITDRAFNIDYKPGKNDYLYEFAITFYYSETLKDNTKRQGDSISWNMGKQKDQTTGTGIINFRLESGAFFFQKIAAHIVDDKNVVSRQTDSLIISVYGAGKDWYYYLLANLPSSGINQNRLDYTNIQAEHTVSKEEKYALGLFSSRSVTTQWFRDLSSTSPSRDSLFYGRFTGHLKFTDIY